MSNVHLQLAALMTTYTVFGGIGYLLAGKSKVPVAVGTWVLLAISMLVLGFSSLGETWLFAVDGFRISFVKAAEPLIAAMTIGLVVQEVRTRGSAARKTV